MKEFLEDDAGKPSLLRLTSLLSLLMAGGSAYITMTVPDVSHGLEITWGFMLGAFAPKVLQKFIENDATKKKEDA